MKWKRLNESNHKKYVVTYMVLEPFWDQVSVQADSEEDAIQRAIIGLKRDYKKKNDKIKDIEVVNVKSYGGDAITNGFGYDDIVV